MRYVFLLFFLQEYPEGYFLIVSVDWEHTVFTLTIVPPFKNTR
jgi:hypothetical protein